MKKLISGSLKGPDLMKGKAELGKSERSDLMKALSEISKGYTVNYNDVRLFAKVLYQNSFPAFIGGWSNSFMEISHKI